MNPADIAYGLLVEVGRRDLADQVQMFEDDDGTWYTETALFDDEPTDADALLIDRVDGLVNDAMARDGG